MSPGSAAAAETRGRSTSARARLVPDGPAHRRQEGAQHRDALARAQARDRLAEQRRQALGQLLLVRAPRRAARAALPGAAGDRALDPGQSPLAARLCWGALCARACSFHGRRRLVGLRGRRPCAGAAAAPGCSVLGHRRRPSLRAGVTWGALPRARADAAAHSHHSHVRAGHARRRGRAGSEAAVAAAGHSGQAGIEQLERTGTGALRPQASRGGGGGGSRGGQECVRDRGVVGHALRGQAVRVLQHGRGVEGAGRRGVQRRLRHARRIVSRRLLPVAEALLALPAHGLHEASAGILPQQRRAQPRALVTLRHGTHDQ